MAKRLIKIAKELNVGTSTIVEHLHNNGFDIENKPTAKVSEEMYTELLKEFQKSIAIKEKADQLIIGNRPSSPAGEKQPEKKEKAAPPPPETPQTKDKPTPPANGEEKAKPPQKEQISEKKESGQKPSELGVKVVRKIDLDSDKADKTAPKAKKKAEQEPQPPKEKEPQAKTSPQPKTSEPEESDTSAPAKEEKKKPQQKDAPQPSEKTPQKEPAAEQKPADKKKTAPPKEKQPEPKPSAEEQPKAEEKEPKQPKELKQEKEPKELKQEKEPKEPKPAAEKTTETPEPQTDQSATEEKPVPAKGKASKKKPKEKPSPSAKDKPEKQPKTPNKDKPLEQETVEKKPAAKPERKEKEAGEEPPAAKEEKKQEADAGSGEANSDEKKGSGDVHRTATPALRGLKVKGKIDLGKVEHSKRSKKKKEESKPKPKSEEEQPKKKRRRKRKKVAASSGNTRKPGASSKGGGRRSRRDKAEEVREVSKKEVEEKIKATMARISGGGKKKRQKIRRDNRERLRERQEEREQEQESKKLEVTEFISVQELANLMDVSVTDVITTCMNLGVIVSINQRLDAEIIELVSEEFGHEVEFIDVGEDEVEEEEIVDDPEDLRPRAPIVTVMGHVDHGKTSLLDYIRKTKVAVGEAGGITQHIGAYEVVLGDEDDERKKVTFLDTPGHEAFTAMRARGAKVTDIAVIIIAADDNIMPQTKEAISHAQAAGVPMVFAINKVDKPGADPDRIKQELASMDFLVEEWGGKYQSQDISAKTGIGIDELLEKIILEAEILELQANPDREASGTVVEASLDRGRGYVTKILVQSGTLEIGDPMVAGEHSGKVKAMFNELGQRIEEAGPSTPVLVLGLSGAPQAGERFRVMESEQETRALANKRSQIAREQANRATKRISLDEIGRRLALGNFKELNLIVKGDVDGSVEALADALIKQSIETVQVNVIHKGVGQIIESDVLLASASDAIIIGFQVRPSMGARRLAEREGVEINTYSVIYKAIEEIRAAIEGLLEPSKEEKVTAQVEVRDTFKISKVGTVAGCYVQEGKITRNTKVRVIRDGIVIYPTKEGQVGELSSLKRFKDDVREVKSGLECGLSIKNYNDIKVGDMIEGYEIVEIKQTLD